MEPSLVSHYLEDGTPVRISHKQAFIENVWKQLAAEQTAPAAGKFEMNKYMQHIHAAHGEMKVIQDILESIMAGTRISLIEVPSGSSEKPPSSPLSLDAKSIAQTLRDEADRLEASLKEMHEETQARVLPLTRAGWNVSLDEEGWKVDIDPAGLFSPIHPRAPPSAPIRLSTLRSLDETPPQSGEEVLLYINGVPLPLPKEESEVEKRLFLKQLSLVSALIYRSLYRMAREDPETRHWILGAQSFVITDDTGAISMTIRLATAKSTDAAIESADPTLPGRLLASFIANPSSNLLSVLLPKDSGSGK